MAQPNLVVIGAQKSGTTSLYHHMKAHPEIFMSHPIKEPGYFMKLEFIVRLFNRMNRDVSSRQKLLEEYMSRGFNGQRYFGDASTYYTIGIFSKDQGIPERMRQVNPEMRLIYIVRNPLARIVSSFLHDHRQGRVDIGFKHYFKTHQYRVALSTSRYWSQLSTYLDHFPREQIKVVLFEDLVDESQSVMDDVCEFLGLQSVASESVGVRNRSENRSAFTSTELLFPVKCHRDAVEVLQPEIRELESFMGRELAMWDLSAERWCGRRRAVLA